MIKSQQSGDENEGFFKPIQQVISSKHPQSNQIQISSNHQEPNEIINHSRPNDFKARILANFSFLNHYPDYLIQNKCQVADQQLISLPKINQKLSKKYLTLQEKYKNNEKYKLIYSKLIEPTQFNSYIFSLQGLTDYSQNNYISTCPQQQISQLNDKFQNKQKNANFQNNQAEFVFDSNFESGNLLYAFQNLEQTKTTTFDLIIQNDTNTKGYNQWFYFSILKNKILNLTQNNSQTQLNQKKTIRINIVNFIKKHLMFQDGVRPVGFFGSQGQWKFVGRQTSYKKGFIKRYTEYNGSTITKNYYTLSFLLDFTQNSLQQNQKVYIALNYPYPFKRAISFIDNLISSNRSNQILITKQTLCHTISNNQVPYLTISSQILQKQIQHHRKTIQMKRQREKQKLRKEYLEVEFNQIYEQNQEQQISEQMIKQELRNRKKKILILARQHPGQSVGSFVLQGFLKQLMEEINQKIPNDQQAQSQESQSPPKYKGQSQTHYKLLKEYAIYVFPMINVDGVIYGNFRTNLGGFDMNRQWIEPNKWLHPQIYHLKKFVAGLKNIEFVLDFHGHSRKLNSFIYACNNPVPILLQSEDQNNYPSISMFRLYPYILSKECELFSIKDCTYTISRDKIKTARINTFKNLNYNPYVFTLETGFFGYNKEDKKIRYKIEDFFKIGKGALQSLKTVLLKPKKVKQFLKEVQAKGYLFDKWTYENKQDPGSESNPSEDELNPIQIKAKVFSDDKIKQKQKNQFIKIKEVKQKRIIKKKQKVKKSSRKVQTELKSQRTIVKVQDDEFKLIQQKKAETTDQKRQKSRKNQKNKSVRIEYIADKKKNSNSELFNVVMIKQAIVQKPQFHLPEPNYRERVMKVQKKPSPQQDFKSTSNLLGTGISYFQRKGNRFGQPSLKTNPATIQMLQVNNLRRDVRIQSFSSVNSNENMINKVNQTVLSGDNKIKDLFYSLSKVNDKGSFVKGNQRQRIYVVRQNKIVKIVNNVNKNKSQSQSAILQSELNERQNNLRRCQDIMCGDNKILIEQIKQQKNEQNKKKKKVYLHPIQY